MFARVTLAEIDPVRMSVSDAVERFKALVEPALREQSGYEGVYVGREQYQVVLAESPRGASI